MTSVKKKKVTLRLYKCGDCAHCEPVTTFHTLTVHGRKPTLGICPYWTQSRCTLLSWKSYCEHFKPKNDV